jgi:hypothetical protein
MTQDASLAHPSALACITRNQSREDMMRNRITLASDCDGGVCPRIDQWTDTGDFGIQGYRVADADKPADLPAGEDMVMIPRDVLPVLIAQLQRALAAQPA